MMKNFYSALAVGVSILIYSGTVGVPDAQAMGKGKQKELEEELRETKEKLAQAEQKNIEIEQEMEQTKRKQSEEVQFLKKISEFIPGTGFRWDHNRCNGEAWNDSLSPAEAKGRYAWTLKCLKEKVEEFASIEDDIVAATKQSYYNLLLTALDQHRTLTGVKNTHIYPTFGVYAGDLSSADPIRENPLKYIAPKNPKAECNIPEGYTVVAVCESSCYTPDQLILFDTGYEEIAKAKAADLRSIMALDVSSTPERPLLRVAELTHYITSIVEGHHEVIDLLTESGRSLTVTTNHPMLKAEGVMVEASELSEGDLLLTSEGQPDPIVQISGRSYFGKVYNVRLGSAEPIENIIIANGLLTGTSFYQNEGQVNLNRRLFRINLPDELIEELEGGAIL